MANEILKVVPVVQSVALVGNSMRLLRKKKKKSSDFLGVAAGTIVGSALIQAESKMF